MKFVLNWLLFTTILCIIQKLIFAGFFGTSTSTETESSSGKNLLGFIQLDQFKESSKLEADLSKSYIQGISPLKDEGFIMFWRPQKVGSSTILSILISYGFRYNLAPKKKASSNSFCRLIAQCALKQNTSISSSLKSGLEKYVSQKTPGQTSAALVKVTGSIQNLEKQSLAIPYKLVLSHEICALQNNLISPNLECAFNRGETIQNSRKSNSVKQIFLVREPLARAISVYYFWGELSKLVVEQRKRKIGRYRPKRKAATHRQLTKEQKVKLGQVASNASVERGMFRYHGVESTVPPNEYALDYAQKFPYRKGMPGPSFTWSAFASSAEEAIEIILSEKMSTLVLERLEESLVVLVHDMKWSLADVVVTMQRKALSSHPKYTAWPADSIRLLEKKLTHHGEFNVYDASKVYLDRKIARLKESGVNVDAEVQTLKELKQRVSKICLDINYLEKYREYISQKLPNHDSQNKLRDVDEIFSEKGHIFSFNKEILGTFDLCGPCEAHALLLGVEKGLSKTVANSTTLFELDRKYKQNNIHFRNCPF